MKKKIFLVGLLAVVAVSLFGCGKSLEARVEENLSERTCVYYFAEGEGCYATLSSGEREEEYLLNGKSENKVDFALLSIKPSTNTAAKLIKANVSINDHSQVYELELNDLNGAYMVDLEQRLSGDESIVVEYAGEALELQNLSKDFVIDDAKAIEIACNELAEKIDAIRKGNNLNAECYLRVLDKKANNFDDMFWCFTVVGTDKQTFSVIISTVDGSILAKSE